MNPPSLEPLLAQLLDQRRHAGLLRTVRQVQSIDATHVHLDERVLINFASNDYLGLTHHPRVCAAVADAARAAAGSGASPLITGRTTLHASAESILAAWKRTESAVLLPSGYQAAHAAIQTFAALASSANRSGGVRFLIDKLAHASLIDAVRASGLPMRVFGHNDTGKLRRLLERSAPGELQVVVTESIFSMDGDAADLSELARLKQDHAFTLLLDEAHGSGVYGPAGAGYAAELGLPNLADVYLVTLSKAFGLAGGALCASRRFCSAVANVGRAYIYSTSPPPSLAAGVIASLAILRDEPHRQQRVRELARRVRVALQDQIAGGLPDCPIVPIVLGSESAAMDAAASLEQAGLLVAAVRPPTVPRNTSRLRITLSCEHTDQAVGQLLDAVRGML